MILTTGKSTAIALLLVEIYAGSDKPRYSQFPASAGAGSSKGDSVETAVLIKKPCGELMKRKLLYLALAGLVLSNVGCASCKRLFGLDRRCESPPPPQYYSAPPMVSGPANYSPPPACTTNK